VTETADSKSAGLPPEGRPSNAPASSVEQLVAARQAARLGASDMAAKLGMSTRQVEALERGDWKALPGHAFVRGALRSYGKTLGLGVEPLLASLGGQVSAPELRASASLDMPIPRNGSMGFGSSGSGGRIIWIVLGVLAAIAIALYSGGAFELGEPGKRPGGLWDSGRLEQGASTGGSSAKDGGADEASSEIGAGPLASRTAAEGQAQTSSGASLQPLTPLVPLAPPATAVPAGPGVGGQASAPPSGQPGPAPAAGGSAAPVLPGASDSSLAPAVNGAEASGASGAAGAAGAAGASGAGAKPAASGEESLRLQFRREAWVEIRGAGEKLLLTGMQRAGSHRELSGRRPFDIVIGNAAHVFLEVGGKPVDLSPYAARGVARFKLE
jgi:cytoskeleton protein RodZ